MATTDITLTVCYDSARTGGPLHRVLADRPLCGAELQSAEFFDAPVSYVVGLECSKCRARTVTF